MSCFTICFQVNALRLAQLPEAGLCHFVTATYGILGHTTPIVDLMKKELGS
jgi:hypothetical protein